VRPRLLLDECVESKSLIRRLRDAGYDLVTVTGAGLGEAPDEEIGRWAIRERRAVLTQNCDHYLALVVRFHPQLTVLGLRQGYTPRERLSESELLRCLENLESLGQDYTGTFVELHEYKW
jgi:predicted nuclease of predicted toxin-antitoxin system